MPNHITANNLAVISGQITGNFYPCPGKPEKKLCMSELAVKRLSGHTDYIPVTTDGKTASKMRRHTGQNISITGRLASYNYHDKDGSHLCLSLSASTHAFLDTLDNDENSVFLDGYISRPPVFRTTPLGRQITDLTIASGIMPEDSLRGFYLENRTSRSSILSVRQYITLYSIR